MFEKKLSKIYNLLNLFFLIRILLEVALVYPGLPAKIPTHFNISGEIDGWGSKGAIILFVAIVFILNGFLYTLILQGQKKGELSFLINIPGKNLFKDFSPEVQKLYLKKVFEFLRGLLVSINLIFIYIFFRIIESVKTESSFGVGLNPWIFILLLAITMLTLIYYYTLINRFLKEHS